MDFKIEPNPAKNQEIIYKVCKAHNIRSFQLTDLHIKLMDECIEEYKSTVAASPSTASNEDKAVQQAAKEYAKIVGFTGLDTPEHAFLAGASFNSDAVEFPFAEWASHSDWTYLPSKKLWYNEEDEENITPKTTQELYNLFKQIGQF